MYNKILKIGIVIFGIFILCFFLWHILPVKKRLAIAQGIELACPSITTSLGNQFDIRNPSTGRIRQYFCIDPSGNFYFNGFNVSSINGILYVNGVNYSTLGSALANCPSSGCFIIDTSIESFSSNPFVNTSNPVKVTFEQGIWTTTIPLVLTSNQWITGASPQSSQIKAITGFPSGRGIVELGATVESHGSFVRDINLNCNSIVGCSGLVYDGAQNPSGALNVNVTNYMQDGVRIQQTSAASSGISLRDMWLYSPTGIAPTGSGVNAASFSGSVIVDNVTQASDHAFPGTQSYLVSGGSGQITFIGSAGEGSTDMYRLTGTSARTTIIGVSQNASTNPSVNTVHVGAGVIGYTLINVSQGNSTVAALQDDNRSYTFTGGITYWSTNGGTSRSDFGSGLSPWVLTSPIEPSGTGPVLTGTGACATFASQSGGIWGGQFFCTSATGASTVTITFPATASAIHGWNCADITDQTTPTNKLNQTNTTATTCVLTSAANVNANDKFIWHAFPY